jgi:hypothetical protein
LTRIGNTLGHIGLAKRARESRVADTRKAVQSINAASAVLARIRRAFIDVGLADRP